MTMEIMEIMEMIETTKAKMGIAVQHAVSVYQRKMTAINRGRLNYILT